MKKKWNIKELAFVGRIIKLLTSKRLSRQANRPIVTFTCETWHEQINIFGKSQMDGSYTRMIRDVLDAGSIHKRRSRRLT